ncbi:MAG: J domain-containing protein, partial [Acidobacteriota bacterium]
MRPFDPYEALGVARDADGATIRRAYQKLARRHHPDLAPGDREAVRRFSRIQRAYAVLGDPERRRRFDEGRAEPALERSRRQRRRESVTTGRLGSESFLEIRSEWMEWIDGPPPESSGPDDDRTTADVHAEVTLAFTEAVRGCTTSFSVQRERVCGECRGRGRAGSGRCERCAGRGTVVDLDRMRVRIPAGVADGDRLRLPGKGAPRSAGREGSEDRGDLYVTVRVRPHSYFERRGLDVHAEVPVTFAEAVLGAEIEVPTVNGPVAVRLPAGTQGGQRFRLRGRGAVRGVGRKERVGDHYYTVRIVVPTGALGPEERAALERLDRSGRRRRQNEEG